jgi:glycosyltransferase involved in cell wall biosynthesis
VYSSSTIYLHTSEAEGMPGTVLEAMSCECIPICSSVGGIPECVDPEDAGYLIPLFTLGYVKNFIDKIEHVLSLEEKERQEKKTSARRSIILNNNIVVTATAYDFIYRDIEEKFFGRRQ